MALPGLPSPGTVFAGFYIEAEIGRGGAGAVFRVRSPEGERYALKVMLRDLENEAQRVRFEREALAGEKLRHSGVIEVYGAGVEQGLGFMVMELLTGALPLDEFVTQHSLNLAGRVRLMSSIATAVHAAHQAGLIHRDLKPDNVLVTPDGRPKVVDFGLARHMDRERLTQSGATMGTIHYMSPEQIRGQTAHADARTDVYALGVMLYQLLTGKLPFDGGTAIEVMRAALEFEPEPLPPEVSALEPVVRLALAKELDQRYPSAEAFARDLKATESSQGTAASGVLADRSRRRWTYGVFALLAPAGGLIALGVFLASPSAGTSVQERAETLIALRASSAPLASSRASIEGMGVEGGNLGGAGAAEALLWGALLACARGSDLPEVSAEGKEPLSRALRGARGGPQAARDLSRALRGGVARADLYRWRALALGGSERLRRAEARQVLSDAQAWRRGAALDSSAEDAQLVRAEARALLALGEAEAAAGLVALLEAPEGELLWELALAQVEAAVLRRPKEAWEALVSLRGAVPERSAARAQELGRRALLELQNRARDGVDAGEELSARALLLVHRRLCPEGLVPPELVSSLLSDSNGLKGPILIDLALTLGDLFPSDLEIHRELASLAGRVRKAAQRRFYPAIRRAVRLETTAEGRLRQQLTLAYVLAHTEDLSPGERGEFEGLTAEIFPLLEDEKMRAILLVARGRQYAGRNMRREAEADLKAAVECDPAFAVARFSLAEFHADEDRVSEALAEHLAYLRCNERNEGRRQVSLLYGWTHAREPLAVEALEAYLEHDPGHGGWWLRLALLRFEAREPADLASLCSRARDHFKEGGDVRWVDLAVDASEVMGLLDSGDLAQAKRRLKQAVARLEQLRKGESFP